MGKAMKNRGYQPLVWACKHFEAFMERVKAEHRDFFGVCERQYDRKTNRYHYTFDSYGLWGTLKVTLCDACSDFRFDIDKSTIIGIHVGVESKTGKDSQGRPWGVDRYECFNVNLYGDRNKPNGYTTLDFCEKYIRPFVDIYLGTTDSVTDQPGFFNEILEKMYVHSYFGQTDFESVFDTACLDCISAMIVSHAKNHGFDVDVKESDGVCSVSISRNRDIGFNDGLVVRTRFEAYKPIGEPKSMMWLSATLDGELLMRNGDSRENMGEESRIDVTLPGFYETGDDVLDGLFRAIRERLNREQ